MSSLAPRLPVERSTTDGYVMVKDFSTLIRQNFKNLVLTAPGERMMDPAFGVGLRNFLFEQNTATVRHEIEERIYNQAEIYLPFIQLVGVDIVDVDESNTVTVTISYRVPDLNAEDRISVSVSLKNT